MSEASLVSVIIPYFKSDKPEYFDCCLKSVLKSTYRPLEIILIRDGAVPDSLIDIVAKFDADASVDPSLSIRRVNLETNLGPGAARNRGIQQASGDFVAILDSDDEMFEDRIQIQTDFLRQNPEVGVVGSNYVCVDGVGRKFAEVIVPSGYSNIKFLSSFMNPIANPTVMARASVFRKYLYAESLRFGEDYSLWIRMLGEGVLIENAEVFGIKYRSTDTFVGRRKGIHIAISDLKNKLASLRYQPFWVKPIVIASVPLVVLVRTLPAPLVSLIYTLRRRML